MSEAKNGATGSADAMPDAKSEYERRIERVLGADGHSYVAAQLMWQRQKLVALLIAESAFPLATWRTLAPLYALAVLFLPEKEAEDWDAIHSAIAQYHNLDAVQQSAAWIRFSILPIREEV